MTSLDAGRWWLRNEHLHLNETSNFAKSVYLPFDVRARDEAGWAKVGVGDLSRTYDVR